MSRLDETLARLGDHGAEFKALGDAGTFIRGNGLQKKDFAESGVGCIHYGQIHTHYGVWATRTVTFVGSTLAKRLRFAKTGDLVIATTSEDDEAVGKAVAWLGADDVAVSSDAYIYRHSLDPKFVAYFFQSEQFRSQKRAHITGTKVRRLSGDSLAKIRIPVPPVEIQREVVKVLDSFRELEAELKAELKARRQQYQHYRDALISCAELDAGRKQGAVVQWSTLGEAFVMQAGQYIGASHIAENASSTHPFPCYGANGVRGFVRDFSHEGLHVLIGRQGALCGNVQRVSGKFYATEHAVVTTAPSGKVDMDWAFHMLTAMNLNQYATKSAQPGLAVGRLGSVKFPIPSLASQARVATILDQFDALVGDLSFGLPAELQARRQQYEYYRDQLLTFREAA